MCPERKEGGLCTGYAPNKDELPQAAAPDRGPGPRPAEDGRGRQVLHRHPDPGLRRDQGAAVGGARPARRPPRRTAWPQAVAEGGDVAAAKVREASDAIARLGRTSSARDATDRAPPISTIGGMTCASCAARIEKKLNKLDGVTATVNFATETARVSVPGRVTRRRPCRGGGAGRVHRRAARPRVGRAGRAEPAGAGRASRGRRCYGSGWSICAVLAVPRGGAGDGARAAVPRLAVGVAGAGHAGVRPGARGRSTGPPGRTPGTGAATMDTLISVGVTAAYLWSLYALFFGSGTPGLRTGFALFARDAGRTRPTWTWPSASRTFSCSRGGWSRRVLGGAVAGAALRGCCSPSGRGTRRCWPRTGR